MPNISIIVPTYNSAKLLILTIHNIQKQTFTNWECLIIDDGSTDNTKEVIHNYLINDDRIKYFYKPNGGLSSARNFGIKNVSGKYIQFLDSDDYLQKNKLLNQVREMEKDPSVDIIYTEGRYFESENENELYYSIHKDKTSIFPNISGSGVSILSYLIKQNIMPVNSALIKKEVIDKVGLFDENLNALEDWDYWIRCASESCNFKFIDIDDSYPLIRIHEKSMTNDINRMHEALIKLRIKHNSTTFNNFPKLKKQNITLLKKDVASPYFMNLYHKKNIFGSIKNLIILGIRYNSLFYNITRGLTWLLKNDNE